MYLSCNVGILETDIIQLVLKLYLTKITIKFAKFDSIENLRIISTEYNVKTNWIISVSRNARFDERLEAWIVFLI